MTPLPRFLCVLIALVPVALPASAQTSGLQDPLLDRLIGEWVLEGTIAGRQTTHDVTFDWVLGHEYVRLHEVSRERDAAGRPEYEAIVFIGQGRSPGEYACLWLDSTGGGGLSSGPMGYGVVDGDSIPFLFKFPDGTFHTTFVYDRSTDTWGWHMDGEEDGALKPFARVTLSRKR